MMASNLVTALLLLVVVAASTTTTATTQSSDTSSRPITTTTSPPTPPQAKAEALVASANLGAPAATAAAAAATTTTTTSANSKMMMMLDTTSAGGGNQNVIVIKYANVSKQLEQMSVEMNDNFNSNNNNLIEYRLYNEPLSVPVIESKFSHSIQLFDVSHNQLSTLSKDLFCPLSNEVRQLNISHNLLENFDCLGLISQAGQLCLSELRVLDMSYNLIKHLPATGVATLQNLEVLNLSHNLIESLDELSLSSLFKLTRLDLSYNRLQQLPARIFHKSTSIQVLKLQANNLQQTINHNFLVGLISLEELNLSFNNLSHISESAFIDKPNLTRVDLSHNHLNGLRQEALRVTILSGNAAVRSTHQQQQQQQTIFKPRLHHNGQYAGLAQVNVNPNKRQAAPGSMVTEFYLSSNPFVCDCQLDWMRKFQQPQHLKNAKNSVLSSRFNTRPAAADGATSSDPAFMYINDQPTSTVIQSAAAGSSDSTTATTSNNINSENVQSSSQQQQQQSSSSTANSSAASHSLAYGRIGDLDLIKCSPLFKRNAQLKNQHNQQRYNSRSAAPSSGDHQHHLAVQVHHANNHLHHHHHQSHIQQQQQQQQHQLKLSSQDSTLDSAGSNMIDLLTADSSNFLCRYKSHCFALCHCCEFDACDCEMICPTGCNCYYDSSWQTNIIDCSSNNHTVVPDRIPMDVSGLYLDGNNIDSLKPSNLIARRSLKTLYLNSSNLQYIANRTFNGLIELQTLYLNDNMLRTLNGYEFEPLAQLRALYLQSNRLDHINQQTFIYLRSLEVLDLSQNRLTSTMNFDLFMSIGHNNIRLRQLSIAHNWWSCQCNQITSFRQILKHKFLVNGGVNIADRNQLRCYYNSTTVGPLILDGPGSSSSSGVASSIQSQPIFGSFPPSTSGYSQQQHVGANNRQQQQQQQQQLTEINQCSEMIEERPYDTDINPPIIQASPMADYPPAQSPPQQNNNLPPPNDSPADGNNFSQQYPNQIPFQSNGPDPSAYPAQPPQPYDPMMTIPNGSDGSRSTAVGAAAAAAASAQLTSFVFVSVLFVCIFVVAISVFIFIRQQQRYHHHHHHHKKSSAASTISVSSSASSTAISSAHHHHHHNTAKFSHREHATHQHQAALHFHHHTLNHHGQQQQQHLIMGTNGHQANNNIVMPPQAQNHHHHHHHQHSASSQSNIYAALVSPTTGSSTIVTQQQQQPANPNNLYSNSSTTGSSSSQQQQQHINGTSSSSTNRWQHQLYGANPMQQQQQLYGQMNADNPYAINSTIASYKTGTTSLYNGLPQAPLPAPPLPGSNCQEVGLVVAGVRLPKVKQFMSKLVNKSLALSGYRSSNLRDELSAVSSSDKIYDAFLSYDKRDEPFVVQHLSAELEYGQPQYRVANRYRDLPLPTSAYIGEAITSVIGCSHRTIIVLSENYLSNEWCRHELQAALRETALDKSHKIIAVVLEPKCLLDLDPEMRALLMAASSSSVSNSIYGTSNQQQQQQTTQQLVQLADGSSSPPSDFFAQQQQLVTTLTNQSNGNQQVCTQTASSANKITFINYNERKFWPKIKQLMPVARPSSHPLTLTTKN